jgi:SWI/SNF-related matrix-associated actin-dependent regulator of chromatin subfamily B member 1
VRIGRITVRDQFEWDINNPDNSPEDFADCMCADLGLSSDFVVPIAHQIREKVLELQKVAHADRRSKGGVMTDYFKD